MKKILILLSVLMMFVLACGKETSSTDTMKNDMKAGADDKMMAGKILVVYHSATGTTEKVAKMIQEKLGADILKIEPEKEYNMKTIEETVKKQMANKEKTAIKLTDKNIADYDTVIIGTPAWFSEISLPLQSYLEEQDFSGKTVAMFTTYGGTYGNLLTDFEKNVKAKEVKKGIAFSGKQVNEGIEKELDAWLETLK